MKARGLAKRLLRSLKRVRGRQPGMMKRLVGAVCLSMASLQAMAEDSPCPVSTKVLMDIPKDHGPRAKDDVIPVLAEPGLFDLLMTEPRCSRQGKILMAITIAPDGSVVKVNPLDSTLPDTVVQDHLLALIPSLNFCPLESQLYSVVYIPFMFDH